MKTANTPTKAAGRRAKSAVGGHGATDLHRQILNYDRVNALPAAAREHEHFYLLLFRNLIRQLALLLVFCTIAVAPACGDEISERIFFQGFSREQPGDNSTREGKIHHIARLGSWFPCTRLISFEFMPDLSRAATGQNTGNTRANGTRLDRRGESARHVLRQSRGGAGSTLGINSKPVTPHNYYE